MEDSQSSEPAVIVGRNNGREPTRDGVKVGKGFSMWFTRADSDVGQLELACFPFENIFSLPTYDRVTVSEGTVVAKSCYRG